LWDQQVAAAYRRSFDEFSRRHPAIEVRVDVVAYSTYFDALRTDVAGGSADDIFWISNAYFAPYADSGRLVDITNTMGPQAAARSEPSVVEQFTRRGTLWGVPQLTDAGIALYYNADLLSAAGVDPATLNTLRWSPDDAVDTFRPLLARLAGDHTRQWAYNAGNDLQGIYLNYVGSAGGVFADDDRFAFDNPQAAEAFRYLVRLINVDRVSPPASDTNDNSDFSRNMFLQGRMTLFQSGTYNLAQVEANAAFRWGVALLPAGPVGRISVTNGIAAAGNSASPHPAAVREVLEWMGSADGNAYLGAGGAAVPAVLAAQRTYFDYWAGKRVDVAPFFDVLRGPRIPAPGGAGFAAGFEALKPYFDEMFLGRLDVGQALARAQAAANAAAER
jgi:multiple sugar transport system substrate-binding protein